MVMTVPLMTLSAMITSAADDLPPVTGSLMTILAMTTLLITISVVAAPLMAVVSLTASLTTKSAMSTPAMSTQQLNETECATDDRFGARCSESISFYDIADDHVSDDCAPDCHIPDGKYSYDHISDGHDLIADDSITDEFIGGFPHR
jgi:hypothetical protein